MAKYICKKCGYIYDEESACKGVFFEEVQGQLEEGFIDTGSCDESFTEEIAGKPAEGVIHHGEQCEDIGIFPGTKWEDVPSDFKCPQCGAEKEEFELVTGDLY